MDMGAPVSSEYISLSVYILVYHYFRSPGFPGKFALCAIYQSIRLYVLYVYVHCMSINALDTPGAIWASSVPRLPVFIWTMNNYGHWKSLENLKNCSVTWCWSWVSVCLIFCPFLRPRGRTEKYLYRGFTQYSTGQAFMPSEVSHKVKSFLLR